MAPAGADLPGWDWNLLDQIQRALTGVVIAVAKGHMVDLPASTGLFRLLVAPSALLLELLSSWGWISLGVPSSRPKGGNERSSATVKNRINGLSRGSLRVAMLGSSSFDVEDVGVTTLGFGRNGSAPRHDLSVPKAFRHHLRDESYAGYTNLTMHYRIRDVGFSIRDAEACLRDRLVDGTGFEGCDSIWLFGHWGARRSER